MEQGVCFLQSGLLFLVAVLCASAFFLWRLALSDPVPPGPGMATLSSDSHVTFQFKNLREHSLRFLSYHGPFTYNHLCLDREVSMSCFLLRRHKGKNLRWALGGAVNGVDIGHLTRLPQEMLDSSHLSHCQPLTVQHLTVGLLLLDSSCSCHKNTWCWLSSHFFDRSFSRSFQTLSSSFSN